MNSIAVREKSLMTAKKLGYRLPEILPMPDVSLTLRPNTEIQDRALALSALVAASYGFSRDKVLSWLKKENLTETLTKTEEKFLLTGKGEIAEIQNQVESLCAFAWAFSFLPVLDFSKETPNYLVTIFPNFKATESSIRFRQKAILRPSEEVIQAADIAYCLHWVIVQEALDKKPVLGQPPAYIIVERRRALEWMLSNSHWDEVSLDT